MICPYCGAENDENTAFCISCGFDMSDHSETAVDPLKTNTQVRPHRRKPRRRRRNYKPLLLIAVCFIAVVTLISVLSSLLGGNRIYHAYKHNIMVEIDNGKVAILQDAKKAKITDLDATSIAHHQASLDGSVLAILTDRNTLAVIQGRKLTVVAENVNSFVLSVDGTGIGFVAENKEEKNFTLKLYNVKTKKVRDVTYQQSPISFDLAPDGDSLAYYVKKDGQESSSLVFFDGKKNTPITDHNITFLGLSNDGKNIYTIARDDHGDKVLYCYNNKGQPTLLGSCNIRIVYMNEDHTQILYFNSVDSEGEKQYETYISSNGDSTSKVVSAGSIATPIMPKNCMNFTNVTSVTVPVDNLYDKVYSFWGDNGSDIWMLRENQEKSVKLVSGAYDVTISNKGDYVFYTSDNTLKVLKVSNGKQASQKAVVLAEDVIEYVVTSDRKLVYYRTSNGVYSVNTKNGKGEKTVASKVVADKLYINAENIVYYTIESDVYASKNGRKGKIIISKAQSLYSAANGVVYVFMKDDSLYATIGTKQPRLVWSEN